MTMDSRPRIMVVDDDAGMRLTLEGIMEDEGYDVVGAGDGYEAIKLAKGTPFTLIFMDIKMPGINGVEAYREIKKVSPDSVVVMMTGFAVEDLVKEALQEGVYAVLYKPFAMEQIIDVVQAVLKTTFVLVVDDRATDRETLRAVLEERGYEVSEAQDGAQAVSMAAERHYKVILMDVMMPSMDGYTACEEIRKIDPQVKIIFITGYALEDAAKEALRAGAYTVVTKPVGPEQLLALMSSVACQEAEI